MPRRTASLLLACVMVLTVGIAVACSRDEPRLTIVAATIEDTGAELSSPVLSGTALRISAPEGLHDRIAAAGAALAEVRRPAPVPTASDAELSIELAAPSDRAALRMRTWVVATSAARLDRYAIQRHDLDLAAAAGVLYAPEHYLDLMPWLLPGAPTPRGVPAADLPATLDREPRALAIVPLDTLTTQVRALAVDGIDPARGEGDLEAYPLVTRGRIASRAGTSQVADAAVALARALAALDPAPVRITFTGDIIPTRCVYDRMRAVGDWAAPFRMVAERLAAADLTIGSLDAAISGRSSPIGCRETYSLLAPPQVIAGFRLAGFDAMTVATNHVRDCGADGFCGDGPFLDTLAHLRAAGVTPFGGGNDRGEAHRPAVLTAGGTRFAFLGYDDIAPHTRAGVASPGTAGLDLATLADDIRAARAVADVVIVLPQWGEEYTAHPTARQRQAARIAIDGGAALVAGNHPHVVQAAGPLAGGYVAYALGNFVFDQDWSTETTEGVVLETAWHRDRLAAIRFLPVRIEGRLRPVFLTEREGLPILQRMMDAAARQDGWANAGQLGSR